MLSVDRLLFTEGSRLVGIADMIYLLDHKSVALIF